jgi:hypothetical protein
MFYEHISRQAETYFKLRALQRLLIIISCFNLFILALIGLTLRAYPFFSFPFQYKNLLHAHSHFAFGGWVMPVLTWLITKYFPSSANIRFIHWRNIIFLMLFSAYGMLGSFPFQGYAPTSIFFSTVSTIAGFYLAIILWKVTRPEKTSVPEKFLRAGLFYLVLSSIGPFSTAPLIAMGKQGTSIYFDAIYFYLHFQYNGWFTFAILAVLYKIMGNRINEKNGNLVFTLLNIACIPAYFLSILWHKPAGIFYVAGIIAALVQVVAVVFFLKDIKQVKWKDRFIATLFTFAAIAFVVKNLLQFAGGFPAIANLAYSQRNFVISYLHLVLLGFISLSAFAFILHAFETRSAYFKRAIRLFVVAFVVMEIMLVAQASLSCFNIAIPYFNVLIFSATVLLPLSAFFISRRVFTFSTKRLLIRAPAQ